jgi:hypothetical protein
MLILAISTGPTNQGICSLSHDFLVTGSWWWSTRARSSRRAKPSYSMPVHAAVRKKIDLLRLHELCRNREGLVTAGERVALRIGASQTCGTRHRIGARHDPYGCHRFARPVQYRGWQTLPPLACLPRLRLNPPRLRLNLLNLSGNRCIERWLVEGA